MLIPVQRSQQSKFLFEFIIKTEICKAITQLQSWWAYFTGTSWKCFLRVSNGFWASLHTQLQQSWVSACPTAYRPLRWVFLLAASQSCFLFLWPVSLSLFIKSASSRSGRSSSPLPGSQSLIRALAQAGPKQLGAAPVGRQNCLVRRHAWGADVLLWCL